MALFLGASRQKMDDRGRFYLPQRWQAAVAEAGEMIVTAGPAGILWLFERSEWQEQVAALGASLLQHSDRRMLRSLLVGHAEPVTADSSNRIQVGEALRVYADLTDRNAVYLVGCGSVIEIWGEEKWKAQVALAKSDLQLFDQNKQLGAKPTEAPVTVLTTS
jgi:division/cell wall cluster transcriptional repressor MraZ